MLPINNEKLSSKQALTFALMAYGVWGLFPIYFHFLKGIEAGYILAHRIVWSIVLLAVFMSIKQRWPEVIDGIKNKKVLALLVLSTTLLSCNWLMYIWAVTNGFILETSLGYYINPLINVFLGWAILNERLRKYQKLALLFAILGVVYMTLSYGRVPYIALTLAFSFGFYGLIRKIVDINSQPALMIETLLVFIPSMIYLLFISKHSFLSGQLQTNLFLMGSGIITVLPLIWIALALKNLPLSVIGFCQYLAPTLQFLCAILLFKEPFTSAKFITFGLIWIGLIIYSIEGYRHSRLKNAPIV